MLVAGNVVLSNIWGHLVGFGCMVRFPVRSLGPSFAPPLASWPSARPKCPEKVSNDTLRSNTGYLPVYPWIHCEVSLDVVFSWISPGTFPIHKLNQLTVLWKSYWICCHLPWNCTASVDAPGPSGVEVSSVWRCQDILFRGISPEHPLSKIEKIFRKAAAIPEYPTPAESPCCFRRPGRPVPPVRETWILR